MEKLNRVATAAIALCIAGAGVHAKTVTPVAYDMPNGSAGVYSYFDDTYDGAGDPTSVYDALSGGTGQLTDGVIATQSFFDVEGVFSPYSDFEGPYVGWGNGTPGLFPGHPTITFKFDQVYDFASMTIYFDDTADTNDGVAPPSAVRVNGNTPSYLVSNPTPGQPFAQVLDLDTDGPRSLDVDSDEITITIFRNDNFVFVSEVTFEVKPIPLPAGLPLLAGGLSALALARSRRRGA